MDYGEKDSKKMSIMNHSSIDKQKKFMHKIRSRQVYKKLFGLLAYSRKKQHKEKGKRKNLPFKLKHLYNNAESTSH